GYAGDPASYGIDVALVAARSEVIASLIERDGLAALPPEALLLPLGPKLFPGGYTPPPRPPRLSRVAVRPSGFACEGPLVPRDPHGSPERSKLRSLTLP